MILLLLILRVDVSTTIRIFPNKTTYQKGGTGSQNTTVVVSDMTDHRSLTHHYEYVLGFFVTDTTQNYDDYRQ